MAFSLVICSYCSKNFPKDNRHINENLKFGHNFFCSPKCQYTYKNKQQELICENKRCNNEFKRPPHSISPHNFCSRSCAVTINNVRFPKRIAIVRNCSYCGHKLLLRNKSKYCSIICKSDALTIRKDDLIERIKSFFKAKTCQ